MTQLTVTDDQIRRAFERRAAVNLPSDLRHHVIAAVAAEPQRWGWQARAAEALSGSDRRFALPALVAVALLLAAMMAIALVGGPEPAPLGSNQRIAYISGGDLYVAGSAGESPRLVWGGPETAVLSQPMWVDSDTIVIEAYGLVDGVSSVYLVDTVTSAPRLVGDASELLARSPDHRRVAILHDAYVTNRLWIVDLATGAAIADLGEIGHTLPLSWSPDDRWLLGESSRDGSGHYLYRVDLQTGEFSDLATGLCCNLHQPRPVLSPDGSRVAFVDYYQAAQGDSCDFRCGTLWSLDPATGTRQRLTAEEGSEIGPVFSPDGAWVAFMEWVGTGYDVAVVRADGTGRRKLTETGDAYAPVANLEPYRYLFWDPDGAGLTFMRGPAGSLEHELWHVTLDGLMERRIGTSLVSEFSIDASDLTTAP